MKLYLLLSNFLILFGIGYGQNISTFDYKVKRGTLTWDTLTNYEQRRSLCQIPSKVISNMPTIELLNSVLDYPLLADVFIFNSYQEGFNKIIKTFYAVDSLLKRKDLKLACIAVYEKFNPNTVTSYKETLEMGLFMFKINFLDLLIAQKQVYSNFSSEDKNSVLKLLVRNYNEKKIVVEKFDIWGLSTTAWASCRIGNIDVSLQNNPDKDKNYVDFGYTINSEATDEILNRASLQIKK